MISLVCPTCRSKKVTDTQQFFPFCSKRCKLIDLGAWADEKFKIEEPIDTDPNLIGESYGSETT